MNTRSRGLELMICLFLIVTTTSVFWQVRNHDFVNYDDPRYVTENRHVQVGLTWEAIVWAFTSTHASNWHPLTWLSHMIDCQIFGVDSKWHHLTNLLFHICNSLMLFLLLGRITGTLWRSAFVAALFALHPLHVESVAWVAERKDVLSTFLWILTMWAYVRYVESRNVYRYLLLLLSFALGLMAKPMLVTLPFVLLLMDYWPLGRFQFRRSSDGAEPKKKKSSNANRQGVPAHRLVKEKIPLLALSLASSAVTFWAQQSGGAVKPLLMFPVEVRVANALVSYVSYIGKMFWPVKLAVIYSHPGVVPMWQVAGACVLLVCITALVIRLGMTRPYLPVGWLWYVGTLVPVIGLVQVGLQSMANRYTYVPLIGLFIMVSWGLAELTARWRNRGIALASSAGVVLLAFIICTWFQVRHWHSSISLFKHALNVTDRNYLAHSWLGVSLAEQGRADEAIDHYSKALRIQPKFVDPYNNLGVELAKQGKLDEAIDHYSEALRIQPDFMEGHYNLGLALAKQGKLDEAIDHYSEALRIQPDFVEGRYNLGVALAKQGKLDEAVDHYRKALRIKPDDAEGHYNLGLALAKQGKLDKAVDHFSEALKIKPMYAEAHCNLGVALAKQGKLDEAVDHYSKALRIKPDDAEGHYNLGVTLAKQGKLDEAADHFSNALRIKPDYADAQYNLRAVQQARSPGKASTSHVGD